MNQETWRPELIDPSSRAGEMRLRELSGMPGVEILDKTADMLRELAAIREPAAYLSKDLGPATERLAEERKHEGVVDPWVWYPWKKRLVRVLPEEQFVRIRTSRNRHLITAEEQERFRALRIAIAGLSVGSSIALAIVLEGGGKRLRIADDDTLDLSNLNRLPYALDEIGLPKAVVLARRLYEIDPFLELELVAEKIDARTIPSFAEEVDIMIDEIDDFSAKCMLRARAKELGVPLFMATDAEETGLIDIERYDLDRDTPPFLGRIPADDLGRIAELSKRDLGRIAAGYVGDEHTSERMRRSLGDIGRTLVSWPQIGGTALMNGAAVAYAIRMFVSDPSTPRTGRYVCALPDAFRQ